MYFFITGSLNFIAVDYLVYTNEVIGNIVESYPIVWMVLAMLLVAGGICYLMDLGRDIRESGVATWTQWAISLAVLAGCAFAGGAWLHWGYRNLQRENLYATQLQENGCWDFLEAFMANEVDYAKFYKMLPQDEAVALHQELCWQDADGILTVLSPVCRVQQFAVTQHDGWWFDEDPMEEISEKQLREAQAFYQVANLAHQR